MLLSKINLKISSVANKSRFEGAVKTSLKYEVINLSEMIKKQKQEHMKC